ncbi:MAG: type IV toxin-antitoxin system AbiEi family antitoxin domain-containing protein [Solirubrobacterales bacterium]
MAVLAEVAAHQHGVLARGQLETLGVSDSAISRWVAAGRLHRIHPGVYALGHPTLSIDGRLVAGALYGGPGAALSHTTAAWVWALIEPQPRVIHVSVTGKRRSVGSVRVHRTGRLEVTERRLLPVTSLPRTLLDVAAVLPEGQLRRCVAEADYRRLLDAEAVQAALGRGRRGSGRLKAALRDYLPSLAITRSVLEQRFLELCASSGLPIPEVNVRIRRFLVDTLWPDRRLIVELDGAAAHGGWNAIRRDRRREVALRAMGYQVVRYTWEQVTGRGDEVIADLRGLLGADSAEPRPISLR